MKRYIEASPRARQWYFLAAIVWAGLALFVSRINTYFPLPSDARELLTAVDARATYRLVTVSLFYLLFSAAAIFLALKAVRTKQWPPAGMAVPFRTQLREIHRPHRVWLVLAVLLLIYASHIVVTAYAVATTRSMVQQTLRLIGPKP